MCGICGIALSARSTLRIDRDRLVRMRDVLLHRGPDGAGLYLDERIGLGHRRLSIVDVEHGAQPMASDDGGLQLVYNGEIFNHPQLYEELRRQGVVYKTRCDTETILRLYELRGKDCVPHLRGMFAFAIWDARSEELLLVRDRFGVKPLYYALLDDGSLVFASEIKAILASGLIAAKLNTYALPDFLANRAPSGTETLFVGIRRLPPGHILAWRDGSVALERYWDLHYPEPIERSEEAWIEEYRERLKESVRLRLMADVPLGMFLSGGIDSAAITAIMSQLVREPIKTFSVAFAEREANELEFARSIARRFGTDHHEVLLSPNDFFGSLPRLVWHEDEPIAHPSSVALNFVARLAAQHVKVVLTGEGSDESLAGYNRYRVTLYNLKLGRRYEAMVPSWARRAVRLGVQSLPAATRAYRIASRTFLALPTDLDTIYFDNFAVFGRAWQRRLLSRELQEEIGAVDPYRAAHDALERCEAKSLLDRLLYADMATYLHELLMKQDQMSMAASIESRVPFLDHPLVEFTAGMPERMKLRGTTTKYVLRRAMEGILPDAILSRRKMGFPTPVGRWFRTEHSHVVREFVSSERAKARGLFDPQVLERLVRSHVEGVERHDERLWCLVNLELWQRIFVDGEDPASIHLA